MANEVRLIRTDVLKEYFCAACSTHKRYKRTVEECRNHTDLHGNGCFKMRLIDNTPSAPYETLRPKGRWVMKETMIRSPYAKNAYCSECLEETAYLHNYCPNCGAKMEG